MKRILLKLSGEALAGAEKKGFDEATVIAVAKQIRAVAEEGTQIGIVIGGGNFWRGRTSETINRNKADQIGMLATVMNCIYVSDICRYLGLKTEIFTPFVCGAFTKLYSKDAVEEAFAEGKILFFAGGTGHPYFSTDTATVLRAVEIEAEAILLAKAVDGISMYVDKGEFVAIMGASGSGKTTLLNCISTIDTVTSGHITVNNQDITKIKDKDFADFRRENLGFIFQDFNLLDTLTIGENISLSLVINKQNPTDIEKRVHAIADKLGIRDILSKFPYEVSGGQKQRCACARALINEPKLILADEPTGALDSKASRLLLETMSEINKKMQATILMVTHDPFSASFCERILFLKDGKIFNEIFRGEKSRKDFFNEILDILTLLGGEVGNVR